MTVKSATMKSGNFAFISNKLDEISLAIDSLNLWVDKTAGEQGLNIELFREEKRNRNKCEKARQRTYLWSTASLLYIHCDDSTDDQQWKCNIHQSTNNHTN